MVHLDIKPDNIRYNPATEEITLIDFGMADFIDDIQHSGGTSGYMAPEVLSKTRPLTQAADIWSIGVTFATWVR